MFSDKKSKSNTTSNQGERGRNIIGKTTTIIGDIISDGDFRVEGTIEGSIKTSGRLIIGKEGCVKGKANCKNADIEGTFTGNLNVENLLTLKETAKVQGDVVMDKLAVATGAIFNVTCVMKDGVKDLHGKEQAKKTS